MSEFDDEKDYDEDCEDNDSSNSELEKEFEELYNKYINEIRVHLKEAEVAISKAVELSEKYGVPFYAYVVENEYVPHSFDKKFQELDQCFLSEVTEIWSEDAFNGCGGWQKSYC